MGQREDPPTLIIHLSDTRWCVFFFSFLRFGVTNIHHSLLPLLRSTHAFERKNSIEISSRGTARASEKTFYSDDEEDGLCANFPHRQIDLRLARKVAGKQGGRGRVQVETLAGIALPRGLFRPCFAARAARDSCGPTDSPPTREREIRIYICRGREGERRIAPRVRYSPRNGCCTRPRIRPDKT